MFNLFIVQIVNNYYSVEVSFPSNIVLANGECPGVRHQDSQFLEFRIFRFATAFGAKMCEIQYCEAL